MSTRTQTLRTVPHLGMLLKGVRKSKRLSQAELGALVGLSQSRVSQLEQNPAELTFERLMAWCATLGLELSIGVRLEAGTDKAEW